MTQPALAFEIRRAGRHYPWPPRDISNLPTNQWGSVNPEDIPSDLTPLPSITNVLGVLDKPALLGWYAERALDERADCPDCAERNPDAHHRKRDCGCEIFPDDEQRFVYHSTRHHKWAGNRKRDERAEEGTRAHTIAERLTIDAPLPAELTDADEAYADAFMAFWTDYNPTPVHTETTIANPDHGYAGTGDLFATLHGNRMDPAVVPGLLTVIDYKTRGDAPDDTKIAKWGLLYETNRLQLAALAYGTHHCTPDGHELMDPVTQGLGVVLFPDGQYRVEVVDAAALDAGFEAFTSCVRVWSWKNGAAA